MKNYLIIVFLITYSMVFSQTVLKGKIVSSTSSGTDLENINVYNLQTNNSTATNKEGFFAISASVGDTLQVSAVQFKSVKIALKEKDFQAPIFYIKLETLTRQLEEVKVKNSDITAVSLGVLSQPAKKYTSAERKLYTARTSGGFLPIDPLLNWISGRTKMLKKELKVEGKEAALQRIEYLFEDNYFTYKLKIPSEKVEGFKYYAVEDEPFTQALKAKNKTLAKFLLVGLASKYLELQKEN